MRFLCLQSALCGLQRKASTSRQKKMALSCRRGVGWTMKYILKFWADTHTLSTQASPKHGRHQHSKTYQGCVSPLTNVPMEQSHGLMKATGHQSRRQPPSRPPNKPWCGTCPVAAARTTAINHLKADTVVEQLRTTQRPWQDTLQRQP